MVRKVAMMAGAAQRGLKVREATNHPLPKSATNPFSALSRANTYSLAAGDTTDRSHYEMPTSWRQPS